MTDMSDDDMLEPVGTSLRGDGSAVSRAGVPSVPTIAPRGTAPSRETLRRRTFGGWPC